MLLFACGKNGSTTPIDSGDSTGQNNKIATNYSFEKEYIFTDADRGVYEITFTQNGLQEGDKLLFVDVRLNSDVVYAISIDNIDVNQATAVLPTQFRSGQYKISFVRGSKSQQAGTVAITIDAENLEETPARVVAHRSGAEEANLPDNSIAALKYAIGLNCYAAECDIYITKDDSVVVCHTESSDDATFGGKVIYNSTYAELKATKKLKNGETLPLLQDFLEVILDSSPSIKLWLDVKTIGANNDTNKELASRAGMKAADIIRRMGAQSRVEYIVGRKATVDACISVANDEWWVGYMNQDYTPQQFNNAGFKWANFDLDKAFFNDPEAIQQYKDAGIRVSVFNADTDAQMNFFINQDMYAICTNYPKKLLEKMEN